MNRVTLIGNVTKDLELKTFNEGKSNYVKFTLAINDMKNKSKDNNATFVNIIAFGKQAEILCKYTTKGRKLFVEGKLSTGSYVNSEGNKRYTTDVYLEEFQFLDSKKEDVI